MTTDILNMETRDLSELSLNELDKVAGGLSLHGAPSSFSPTAQAETARFAMIVESEHPWGEVC